MDDPLRYEPGRATVAAWLCGIARNHVRRRLERERGWEPLDGADAPRESELQAVTADPVADLARAQRIDQLRRAVLSLPVPYREVIVLCELQEMSYAEAAAAIGCALGTVRSRLHRGRALLSGAVRAADEQPGRPRLRSVRCIA
jgi:RNA polymerase sigma-70 factor (ECF subfamily)